VHVGLDLGTGLTKFVTYLADTEYPAGGMSGGPVADMEQTAVAYHRLGSEIPPISSDIDSRSGLLRCDGFPLMLETWPHSFVEPWGGRTAIEVTQSYLRCLRLGDPDDGHLVIAVPPPVSEARQVAGRTRSFAETIAPVRPRAAIRDILAALGRPPSRVVTAPVAAVVYLRHERAELVDVKRFIVCDIGAGSMTIALCEVGPHAIQLVDNIRLSGGDAWSDDPVEIADVEPRPPALIEFMVTDLARKAGAPVFNWTVRRWRALEWLLQSHGDWPPAVLNATGPARSRPIGSQRLLADLRVTTDELLDACLPLAARAAAALTTLIDGQRKSDWRLSGGYRDTKIVFLGGLAGLGPVRAALTAAAGADPAVPFGAVVELDPAARLHAVAHGAALVASGQVRPSQPYPHSLRLPVHRVTGGQLESTDLELAAAGTIDYEQPERMLLDEQGEPLIIEIRPGPFPVQIVPRGSGRPVPASFKPAMLPLAGRYRIAVGGGANGVTVALHSVNGAGTMRFVLNELTVLPAFAR
jgi:hypothetical protein